MALAPALAKLVVHCAVPAVTATALQPEIVTPSALKLTVPVGLLPVTVAVKVTEAPMSAVELDEVSVVVDGGNANGINTATGCNTGPL